MELENNRKNNNFFVRWRWRLGKNNRCYLLLIPRHISKLEAPETTTMQYSVQICNNNRPILY